MPNNYTLSLRVVGGEPAKNLSDVTLKRLALGMERFGFKVVLATTTPNTENA